MQGLSKVVIDRLRSPNAVQKALLNRVVAIPLLSESGRYHYFHGVYVIIIFFVSSTVVGAHVNVIAVRYSELKSGIDVFTRTGEVVGTSKHAADFVSIFSIFLYNFLIGYYSRLCLLSQDLGGTGVSRSLIPAGALVVPLFLMQSYTRLDPA